MSEATQAVLLNGVPLLLLAAAYAAVTGAVLPVLWRDRARAHPLDWALVCVFPGVAIAAGIFGVLVLQARRPLGGHVWLAFVASLAALVPAVLVIARWRDRAFVAGVGHARAAEERVSARDRELEAVAAVSNALTRARTPLEAAKPLVSQVASLFSIGFAGVVLVDDERDEAHGLYAEAGGRHAPWWDDVRVDLRHEPSGIASAVFDAAPVAVYDVSSSPLVSARLAALVGAHSGVFVPLIAEERVAGVLVLAPTDRKRAFSSEELALLQAIGSDAALAFERLRSAEALSDALAREQRVAEIAGRIRGQLDPDGIRRVATEELRATLRPDRIEIEDGAEGAEVHVERAAPLEPGERFLVETVSREVSAALRTASLLAENRRRLEQQGALLHTAQVVTGELELEPVLARLVEEVTKLLDADAADCYLLDRERGVLRCAAVHGLDPALVGFEFAPERGVAGAALSGARPVVADGGGLEVPVPHAAYHGFSRALVAPMQSAGEVLGVLGVATRDRDRTFADGERELLDAFASLASVALRNAESYAERSRQARVQRGFYRISALLGEPLSLEATYDAAARAAAETLGGDFAAVLTTAPGPTSLVGGHDLPAEVRALEIPAAFEDAAADGRILAATDVASDDRLDEGWQRGLFASLLAIPVAGEQAGLVVVFFRKPHAFSREDLELAQQLANAARGALERSRLFEVERTARSLSQQLARTGSLLATELDPIAVLDAVVGEARALVHADAAALASLDGGELEIAATSGDAPDDAIGLRLPVTGWLAGDVVQSRAPVVFDDVETAAGPAEPDTLLSLGHRAFLGVPLVGVEGALQGVLAVYARESRRWREEEVQALVALAANGAVALSNAELYQRVALEREQSVAILANIADGIVAVDREGHVVLWNHAAEEITGVPVAEAIGRTPTQVLQRDLQSETGGTNRLVAIPRGETEVWLSLSEAVMRDPAGAVAGRIFAFRDISSERHVEQMKSDFVSTVSVELRAPLTSIYGFAQTLLREDVAFGETERRTFLEFIARETERLTTIVDALLNVARLETGDLAVAIAPTDVGSIVADVVAGASTSPNGHRIVADVEESGCPAQADAEKLRQVLEQLVSNAVKYSPVGATVTVSAHRTDEGVEIAVSDEGVGIPAAERDRIFSKFYKAGGGQGTGLGLFIAQGLVREMGGRIQVESEEGRGSRFAFQLPPAEM